MNREKNITIAVLCAVVCIMAVAYAAFATTLTINGTASIESSWSVIIPTTDGISCKVTPAEGAVADGIEATGKVTSNTQANFTMKFVQPGDSATCTVKVSNTGSLDAVLSNIKITGNDEEGAIRFTVTGIDQDDVLIHGESTTFIVKGTFDGSIEKDPTVDDKTKDLTITLIYNQKLQG